MKNKIKGFKKKQAGLGLLVPTHYLLMIISLMILSSCEKVVYIDLNNSDPTPVIEANITDRAGPYTVKLSRSVNYYDPNVFPALTDATVVVSDNSGNSETLVQTSDGIYQSTTLQGVAGRLYSLKVSYNGKDYESHSTMPSMVPIDSVMIVLNPPGGGGFGGGHPGDSIPGYKVTCIFKDPPGQGNYYRLVLNSNDTAAIDKSRYRIVSDKLTDDDNISITANTKLKPGDSVTVILECIDQAAYNFFNTLGNVVGDSPPFMSAPPANPVTNISNGGLGYFSAYSYSEKKLVVH